MTFADLLRETLDVDRDEGWENERTPTPIRVFRVRLHSMSLSRREAVTVIEILGVTARMGRFEPGRTSSLKLRATH